jgi:signal transduction histidine kinase
MSSLASGLQQVPFLQPLTDDQIAQLIERGTRLSLPAGETLFSKGDAGHCMYVVLAGQVQIYLELNEGNVVVLSVLEPGDFFGEMALVDGGPRVAGARTQSPCELFVLERAAFLELLTVSPDLLSGLFVGMIDRLRATDERYLKEEVTNQTIRADMERERHRSLARMVAGVAHEVNTPLGIINTAASIIKRELASETVTALTSDRKVKLLVEDLLETTGLLQKNIARAHTLIQSFKNLSVSQIVDTKETLNLPEVVNEILALFSIQARKAKLQVEFSHSLPERQTWVGYRGHLSRILLNLLTNVERYAYPNGSGGKVEVRLSSENGATSRYVLAVRDYGCGIPPENLPHIFEPFFTTGRTQGGSGLGLSMVYNLVTAALHGAVNAESTLNQGTTVTMTFPHIIPD